MTSPIAKHDYTLPHQNSQINVPFKTFEDQANELEFTGTNLSNDHLVDIMQTGNPNFVLLRFIDEITIIDAKELYQMYKLLQHASNPDQKIFKTLITAEKSGQLFSKKFSNPKDIKSKASYNEDAKTIAATSADLKLKVSLPKKQPIQDCQKKTHPVCEKKHVTFAPLEYHIKPDPNPIAGSDISTEKFVKAHEAQVESIDRDIERMFDRLPSKELITYATTLENTIAQQVHIIKKHLAYLIFSIACHKKPFISALQLKAKIDQTLLSMDKLIWTLDLIFNRKDLKHSGNDLDNRIANANDDSLRLMTYRQYLDPIKLKELFEHAITIATDYNFPWSSREEAKEFSAKLTSTFQLMTEKNTPEIQKENAWLLKQLQEAQAFLAKLIPFQPK